MILLEAGISLAGIIVAVVNLLYGPIFGTSTFPRRFVPS